MPVDLDRVSSFLTAHARPLERRLFGVLFRGDAADGVLAALDSYRNADGGYGWGLEPELRAAESQPAGALHALETVATVATVATVQVPAPARTGALLDWLGSVSVSDGGLPFALPVADPTACGPFWLDVDPEQSSLQITAAVLAQAQRVAVFDVAVREHRWLVEATSFCFREIEAMTETPAAHVLSFCYQLLETTAAYDASAAGLLQHLRGLTPDDGVVPVVGGSEGESIRLMDYLSDPDGPVRSLFNDQAVADDLDRLAADQQDDGGWAVDFASFSPAAALDWRGYQTVHAVDLLHRFGR